MPVPSSRTPVRIARGTYANLSTTAALEALALGEVCFATDQDRLYMRTLGGLTAISSTNETAPTPAQVTASPAFTGGTGTQADPYLITNVGSPFSGASLTSAHEITISGTAGDIAVFTDNSPTASADRFKGQDVGILNAAGEFKLNLKYTDNPGTTTDNTTYTGNLQIGTAHITWVVVQSNLTQLSEDTTTTITNASGVGDVITATAGTATGGTAPYTSEIKWQRSFTGIDGFFDTGSTGTTYTITSADAGYYVRAVTTVTDSTDAAQGGPLTIELPSASSAQLNTNQVTTVNSLTLSEDNTAGARFTSQTYSLDAILNPDGVPTSTKSAKVKFEGTFDQYPSTSNITNITSYMDNINQNGGQYIDQYDASGGYSGGSYGNYSTPFLMRNPDTNEMKFFAMTCNHNSSYQMYFMRSSSPISTVSPNTGYTPFNVHGDDITTTTSRWYPNTTGTGSYRDMYENEGNSNGSHYYYNPGPCRPAGDNYYFTVGGQQRGPIYSTNVLASIIYWQRPGWWVTNSVNGYGPDSNWNVNYEYAWTENGSHMVYPLRMSGGDFIVRLITPDISAGENIMTTETYADIDLSSKILTGYGDYQSSEQLKGMWAQGSRIFISTTYYNTSGQYDTRFHYCDFSINDGSDPSHWILCEHTIGQDERVRKAGCAVEANGTRMYIVGVGGKTWRSTNNGDSWDYSNKPVGNARTDLFTTNVYYHNAAYIGNLLYVACRRYTTNSANGQTNSSGQGYNLQNQRYVSTFFSSNDNGSNWNFEGWGHHSSYSSGYAQLEPSDGGGGISIAEEGGWVLTRGKSANITALRGFALPHYQTVTFADTTNLGNDSIRDGNKLRQGSVSFYIAEASQTTKVYSISGGDIVTGEPATSTVSYFGGSQATLYAVLSGAGAVTDLTSSDPGFVNLGYGVDNTITFPGTFPSGNTPDVELPAGTTIQATVEFTNSQGTVTADSNTLTP